MVRDRTLRQFLVDPAGRRPGRWPVRRRDHGFSLIEALIALLVISLVLLVGLALLGVQQRATVTLPNRLAAHRAVEATLESLRAGALVLADGPVRFVGSPPPLPPGVSLWLTLRPEGRPDLYAVRVEARWNDRWGAQHYTLDTLTYQPGFVGGGTPGYGEADP